MDAPRRSTRLLAAGGLLLPGFGAGAVMALTRTTASKVRVVAAPAKYPGATIERVQTGGPGGPAGGRPAAGPPGCR